MPETLAWLVLKTDANSFEKRASLPFLCDLRDFFKDKHPDMWQRMRNANKVVAGFFLQASTEHARDSRALLDGPWELSKCLRNALEESEGGTPFANTEHNTRTDRHTTSPLNTLADLAVAAAAAAGGERGVPVPGSHHQPHDSQAWTSGVGRSASRLNTNVLGLQNEGTVTDQLPSPASYEAGSTLMTTYGQDVHRQWQMYAGQNPETIHGPPAESHASVAAADQVEADSSSDQRDLSAGSCVANHDTPSSHPTYQEVDGRQRELHTPATSTMPNSTAGTQQMQYTHATHRLDNTGRYNLLDRGPVQMAHATGRSPMGRANVGPITTSQVQVDAGSNQLHMLAEVEQSHTQQTIPQHDPLYGAQNNQQYVLGHAGMATGEPNTPSGWWQAEGSRGSHETMAARFLPDSGLNGIYHSTMANGYNTNDEWERMEQELFTRYGDCTNQF
jgi:hypothetical protein